MAQMPRKTACAATEDGFAEVKNAVLTLSWSRYWLPVCYLFEAAMGQAYEKSDSVSPRQIGVMFDTLQYDRYL